MKIKEAKLGMDPDTFAPVIEFTGVIEMSPANDEMVHNDTEAYTRLGQLLSKGIKEKLKPE